MAHNVSEWSPSEALVQCYTVYRSRIEAEDRWIIARVQNVVLSQGFLFAGLSAITGNNLVSAHPTGMSCWFVIAVAAVGVVIGIFGVHGVNAAVEEIQALCDDYRIATGSTRLDCGLPWLTGDPKKRHAPVNSRAIWFLVMLCVMWTAIALFDFYQFASAPPPPASK
jgi:hypothetical protein